MIEPIEQQTLYDLASKIQLQPIDQVVEFGSFFGCSTARLAEGLFDNVSKTPYNKVYAYDSFSCLKVGGFVNYVNSYALNGGVSNLLSEKEDRLDFFAVFDHYLKAEIASGDVKPMQAELRDSVPGDIQQIALMHIDSPKFYEELKFLIDRFFPLLRIDATVIFQDFFYHWSGTLIAAVEAMRQMNVLEYRYSAASSLVTEIKRKVDTEVIINLEQLLLNPSKVKVLILDSIEACSSLKCDRPDVFIPRLWLAAFQYAWEQKNTEEAADLMAKFFSAGGKLNQAIFDDFFEMLRNGFSIRKIYSEDH